MRSSYNVSVLTKLAASGMPMLWFAGTDSEGEPTIDRMRDSSGGQALQAALALCDRVNVYGVGLLGVGGLGGELLYSHYFDEAPGRCASFTTSKQQADSEGTHEDPGGAVAAARAAKRFWSWQDWKRDRVRTEVLFHVWHALGVIRWVQ